MSMIFSSVLDRRIVIHSLRLPNKNSIIRCYDVERQWTVLIKSYCSCRAWNERQKQKRKSEGGPRESFKLGAKILPAEHAFVRGNGIRSKRVELRQKLHCAVHIRFLPLFQDLHQPLMNLFCYESVACSARLSAPSVMHVAKACPDAQITPSLMRAPHDRYYFSHISRKLPPVSSNNPSDNYV